MSSDRLSQQSAQDYQAKTQKNYIQTAFHPGLFRVDKSPQLVNENPSPVQKDNSTTSSQPQKCYQSVPSTEQQQIPWQTDRIPVSKRKRAETSPNSSKNPSHKVAKNSVTVNIPTHNQFESLNVEYTQEETNEQPKTWVPKPEPIFVTGVNNITFLKQTLHNFIENKLYTMTTLKSGHVVKIMPTDIESYKKIREQFVIKNISHYTYALKSEKPYRVVLRGLHASEDTSSIATELKELGHDVRQIVNARHRSTKEPLPLFYVDLEPKMNNKDIFQVKRLNYTVVSFEAPYKKKEILQCKRCQRFGHSKNQCFRPFRCVKCGGDHPTASCLKSPTTEATCANCLEKHPASYKGCSKYKKYRELILKKSAPRRSVESIAQQAQQHEENTKPFKAPPVNITKSYAEALHQNNTHHKNSEAMFDIMNIMFEKFETIMKTMMDNMMDRMVKIVISLTAKK